MIHKNWSGQGDTRNVGLAFARGEYISFVDSDDYIQDTMYEKMITAMKRHRCEIAVCGRVDLFEGSPGGNRKAFCMKEVTIFEGDEVWKEYFTGQKIEPSACWDKLFCSSVIEGLRFLPGKTSEDIYFTYAAFERAKKVAHVGEPFYFYCHRSGSITTTYPVDKSELEVMPFVKKIEAKVWNGRNPLIRKAFYSFYVSTFNVLYEEFRKSAEVDKKFRRYRLRLKTEGLLRVPFVIENPHILPEKRKIFLKILSDAL